MNKKDSLLKATLEALQDDYDNDDIRGKDVLYVLEDFDTGVDTNQSKFIAYVNDYYKLGLDPVKDDLKIAEKIQYLDGDTVFRLIRNCYGDEIADEFEEFFDMEIETLDTSKIKYIDE